MLQDLIKNIVSTKKESAKPASSSATPADTPKKDRKEDKWRSMPEDKQKKLYETTLQPHIMHVVGKYKHKLEKDDLKRWAKELAKKIVDSDFKKGRVEDPSKISDKQAKNVKKHAQEFFEKAVKKKEEADRRKAGKKSKQDDHESHTPAGSPPAGEGSPMDRDDLDAALSDDEADEPEATPAEDTNSPSALKRRREELTNGSQEDAAAKKPRMETEEAPPPPPPPPPPPELDPEPAFVDGDAMDTEQSTLTPGVDVSESYTQEAIAAVGETSMTNGQVEAGAENDVPFKDVMAEDSRPGSAHDTLKKSGVTQTATPPTTGSPDPEEAEKATRRQNFTGMNPDRMRQLGLFDGACD
jgi:histone-lysine N-methyltransferase SETD2